MPETDDTPRRRSSDAVIEQVLLLVESIDHKVETISEKLFGNGEPSKGVVVRLEKLEEAEQRRQKFRSGLVGFLLKVVAPIATIATIGGFIWLATLLSDV